MIDRGNLILEYKEHLGTIMTDSMVLREPENKYNGSHIIQNNINYLLLFTKVDSGYVFDNENQEIYIANNKIMFYGFEGYTISRSLHNYNYIHILSNGKIFLNGKLVTSNYNNTCKYFYSDRNSQNTIDDGIIYSDTNNFIIGLSQYTYSSEFQKPSSFFIFSSYNNNYLNLNISIDNNTVNNIAVDDAKKIFCEYISTNIVKVNNSFTVNVSDFVLPNTKDIVVYPTYDNSFVKLKNGTLYLLGESDEYRDYITDSEGYTYKNTPYDGNKLIINKYGISGINSIMEV